MQTVCEGPRGSGSWEDCHPSHLQALGGVAQAESERESGDGGGCPGHREETQRSGTVGGAWDSG